MKTSEQIQGWFNHSEAYDFLISKVPFGGSFVELGAWLGKSTAYLCDNSRDVIVTVVDTWKGTEEYLDSYYKLAKTEDVYQMYLDNMGLRDRVDLRMTSKEAAKKFKRNSLDVVFIDLDHSYEAVKEDIQLWLPKVKKGGYIAGDDYHENWRGVIKAVDELLPHATFIGDCWIYQK